MTDSGYGTIFSPVWLENAVLDLLKAWMPAYLCEAGRQHGREDGDLPAVVSWGADSDIMRWPEQSPPAVMVASPGLAEPPVRDQGGTYQGVFALEVGVLVASNGKAPARRLVADYGTAVTAVLVQQTLPAPVDAVRWVNQVIDEVPKDKGRSLAAITSEFRVTISDLLTDMGGPDGDPPDDPCAPLIDSTVESVLINATTN